MSQIDLPPTILDVLRADGDDDFFGRSVFELPATPPRAFISNYQELGYLKNGVLTVLSLNRKIQAFRVDPVTFESVPMPIDRDARRRGHRLLPDRVARVPPGRVEGTCVGATDALTQPSRKAPVKPTVPGASAMRRDLAQTTFGVLFIVIADRRFALDHPALSRAGHLGGDDRHCDVAADAPGRGRVAAAGAGSPSWR